MIDYQYVHLNLHFGLGGQSDASSSPSLQHTRINPPEPLTLKGKKRTITEPMNMVHGIKNLINFS